jgi:ubiquitin C-terminal hydrolase
MPVKISNFICIELGRSRMQVTKSVTVEETTEPAVSSQFQGLSISGSPPEITVTVKVDNKINLPLYPSDDNITSDYQPHSVEYQLEAVLLKSGSKTNAHFYIIKSVDNRWVLFNDRDIQVFTNDETKDTYLNKSPYVYCLLYKLQTTDHGKSNCRILTQYFFS